VWIGVRSTVWDMTGAKLQVGIMEDLSFDPNHRHNLKYSDISAKEDNSFRNHIR